MLEQLFSLEQLMFYILAAEMLVLILLQIRTNGLLKRTYQLRIKKKENIKQLKEEVKKGSSEIPVVKFEKTKEKPKEKSGYDKNEMAVLQEMMAEFFG
jgi:hypothetical protein